METQSIVTGVVGAHFHCVAFCDPVLPGLAVVSLHADVHVEVAATRTPYLFFISTIVGNVSRLQAIGTDSFGKIVCLGEKVRLGGCGGSPSIAFAGGVIFVTNQASF